MHPHLASSPSIESATSKTPKLHIQGGAVLKGTIPISGAKNAALPLLTVGLLTDEAVTFTNVPNLADIHTLLELLAHHGVDVAMNLPGVTLKTPSLKNDTAPYDIVKRMRASFLVLGPLLTRFGTAKVSLPGGCAIGSRPVDIHIMGMEKLGATVTLDQGYVTAKAPTGGLIGADISMPLVSVTATANIMLAATLAKGTTRIINAAREPEIVDLANCLNQMGAVIQGAGTDTIVIEGVSALKGTTYAVLPDRIETGTYAMAAAMTGGDVVLEHTRLSLIPAVRSVLENVGVSFEETPLGFRVWVASSLNATNIAPLHNTANKLPLKGVDIMTEPYPGFPTDLQAQYMALMTQCEGASMITESIFENRFMHVPELCRMGANITVHGSSALVRGPTPFKGTPVMATDLRASFSLVMAGLVASGETILDRIYHLDRGYESVENKLRSCGAVIERY